MKGCIVREKGFSESRISPSHITRVGSLRVQWCKELAQFSLGIVRLVLARVAVTNRACTLCTFPRIFTNFQHVGHSSQPPDNCMHRMLKGLWFSSQPWETLWQINRQGCRIHRWSAWWTNHGKRPAAQEINYKTYQNQWAKSSGKPPKLLTKYLY